MNAALASYLSGNPTPSTLTPSTGGGNAQQNLLNSAQRTRAHENFYVESHTRLFIGGMGPQIKEGIRKISSFFGLMITEFTVAGFCNNSLVSSDNLSA